MSKFVALFSSYTIWGITCDMFLITYNNKTALVDDPSDPITRVDGLQARTLAATRCGVSLAGSSLFHVLSSAFMT
jgi:hypothetical protein